MPLAFAWYGASPVGRILLAADAEGRALVGAWLAGQQYFGGVAGPECCVNCANAGELPDLPVLVAAKAWLTAYFAEKRPTPADLPLAPLSLPGWRFRRSVWQLLLQIPYGQTTSYGELARKLAATSGKPACARACARAVGGAVGHNPLAIIIPCHRVVGAKGNPGGYAGGLARKLHLLAHEGVDCSRFPLPGQCAKKHQNRAKT